MQTYPLVDMSMSSSDKIQTETKNDVNAGKFNEDDQKLLVGKSRNDSGGTDKPKPTFPMTYRVGSALFYGFASLLIMVVNKNVLTTYHFPSAQVLGLGQIFASIVILRIAKFAKVISFCDFSAEVLPRIWPLPLIYIGNMVFGLGGTQILSLPMMTVIRRFCILITMIAEYFMLNYRSSRSIQFSVGLMITGAVVAAANDLAFNIKGYTFAMLNNVCTAAQGVYTKLKLTRKGLLNDPSTQSAQHIGSYGLVYYNALFVFGPTLIYTAISGDLDDALSFSGWSNSPMFVVQFLMSCILGFVLSYSMVTCTQFNSPLTTNVVGCLKNIIVTYLGMFIGGDYIFSWFNFIGLGISVIGSVLYTHAVFLSKT